MLRCCAHCCCAVLVAASWLTVVVQAGDVTVGLSFTGVTLADGSFVNGHGYAPPDGAGGVGPDTIVQLINGAYAVFDKATGDPLQFMSGRQFWINAGVDPGTGPGTTALGAFNQRILYDPTIDRWFAAALSGQSENNHVLVARSESSDPTGDWQAVHFLGNAGGPGKFADFTRLGVDANGVYIATTNFSSLTGGMTGEAVFSIPKADLLLGTPSLANMARFDDLNSDIAYSGTHLNPVIHFGAAGNHAPLLGVSFDNTDTALYRSDLLNTAAAGATLSPEGTPIAVAQYSLPPKAAQPDGTRDISLIDHRFKANVYQVGDTIYAVHDVKVGDNAGLKWYKIDEPTGTVIQEGLLSHPDFDYYQGSIAANPNGDVVIGFNRSGLGPDGQISIFAVRGATSGGVTSFGTPFLLLAGDVDNYHYVNTRWGDYTTTVVDPFDPNVFWTFQQYAITANSWGTHITQIVVPEPAGLALAGCGLSVLVAVAWRRRRVWRKRPF